MSATSETNVAAAPDTTAAVRETRCSHCRELGHYARTCELAKQKRQETYKGEYCALLLHCVFDSEFIACCTIYLHKKEDILFEKYLANDLGSIAFDVNGGDDEITIIDCNRIFINKATYTKLHVLNEVVELTDGFQLYKAMCGLMADRHKASQKEARRIRAKAAREAKAAATTAAAITSTAATVANETVTTLDEEEGYETAASEEFEEEEFDEEESEVEETPAPEPVPVPTPVVKAKPVVVAKKTK